MLPLWLLGLFLCLSFPIVAGAAGKAPAAAEPPKFELRTEYAREGSTVWAVVWLTMHQGYHVYAHDTGSGGAGMPTVLKALPATGKVGLPVFYGPGQVERDLYNPSKMVRVYRGSVPFFVRMDGVKADSAVKASLDMLICSARNCERTTAPLQLHVPPGGVLTLPEMQTQPYAAQWKAFTTASAGNAGKLKGGASVALPSAAAPQPLAQGGAAVSLAGGGTGSGADGEAGGEGGLSAAVQQAGEGWTFAPRSFQEETEVRGLGKAMLLGLLAGLLLNCMPCVLPVLTLKASAMLVVGDGDRAARLHRFREHNLLFAAGILTQFFLLAVILGTAGLIWGQIFQSTTFVAVMLVIVFLLGLSMLGLFTLPVIDLKGAGNDSPRLQAFLTGIMATLLATPCSGPLLGGVLSWAFMQPQAVLIVVFLSVGLGMSVPYFIFAAKPELAIFLPRPGKWMAVLERLVGFFLLGTSLYLLSILPQEQHLSLLAALLLVAVGGWVWGYFGGYDAPRWRRNALGGLLAVLVLAVVFFAARPPVSESLWEPFDAATFKAELGKEPMLVEFTADWCPNCKFLERSTLTARRVREWQEKYGLKLVRVDLTRPNPEAEALLQALGSSSIPLTAVFKNGLAASAPVVLRDIYSADTLNTALQQMFR